MASSQKRLAWLSAWIAGLLLAAALVGASGAAGKASRVPIAPSTTCVPHNVLIAFSDVSVQPATLQADIAAEPGVLSVDTFDAGNSTPTLPELLPYRTVVAFSNSAYADSTAMGDVLADYQDANGIVVGLSFNWYGPPFGLAGRWMTDGYTPYNYPGTSGGGGSLGWYDAGHPLMAGVTTLNAQIAMNMTAATGATVVARWNDENETNLIAYKGRAVGISAYIGDYVGEWSGQFGKVIANAGNWLCSGGPPPPPPPPLPPPVVRCVVPRVIGLTLRKARTRIRARHCSVGRIRRARSRRAGRVIAQSPRPGRRLARGTRVNLVVGRR